MPPTPFEHEETNMRRTILLLSTTALLSIGAGVAANAQDFTRPDTNIRSLEPPVDVQPMDLRAQTLPGSVLEGRSAYVPVPLPVPGVLAPRPLVVVPVQDLPANQ